MPIHLLWGDDEAARNRAVEALVDKLVDPAWAAITAVSLVPVIAAQTPLSAFSGRQYGAATRRPMASNRASTRSPFATAVASEVRAFPPILTGLPLSALSCATSPAISASCTVTNGSPSEPVPVALM
jgi:DNA polymerase-3 subunit delta